MKISRTILMLAAPLLAAAPANATVVTETINFSFSDFINISAGQTAAAPIDTISGSFTVTFDTSVTSGYQSTNLVVNFLDGAPSDLPVEFSYWADRQWIWFGYPGDLPSGVNAFKFVFDVSDLSDPKSVTCAPEYNTACGTAMDDPNVYFGGYEVANIVGSFFHATTGTVTGGVPEPASWAMMIAGLGMAGAAMRRRRTVVAFA